MRLPSSMRAGQSPLRHADVIGQHEVMGIAPVRVRHGAEHISERGSHLIPTTEPTAVILGSAGSVEHTIVGEQAHQSVNVMAVPCVGVLDKQTFQIVAVHSDLPHVEIGSS